VIFVTKVEQVNGLATVCKMIRQVHWVPNNCMFICSPLCRWEHENGFGAAYLEVLAAHEAGVDVDRTQRDGTALLEVKI
jgi:hypothetical protein